MHYKKIYYKGMKMKSMRRKDDQNDKEEEETVNHADSISKHRRECLKNYCSFVDKMVDDELKEVKTYKIFDKDFNYENPFKCDDMTSIKDDLRQIIGK